MARCKACDCSIINTPDLKDELCGVCLEIALITAGVKKEVNTATILIVDLDTDKIIDEEDANFYCEGDE